MSRKLIVAKFGGTSLKDADAIRQSANIAVGNGAALVVVSATSGTTDELASLADILIKKPSIESLKTIDSLKVRHQEVAAELNLSASSKKSLDALFTRLKNLALSIIAEDTNSVLRELYPSKRHVYRQRIKNIPKTLDVGLQPGSSLKLYPKRISDHILSYGERFSSILIADTLRQMGTEIFVIDARSIIKTDNNHRFATPLVEEIKLQAEELLIPELADGKTVVTQGFIGSAPDSSTTTLGRGGSDYSAALFAEAVNANELQIWSDVAGVATADPRIVDNTRPINNLTFQEAAELATSGAKILYSKTITPLRRSGIPVYVGNTFKPEEKGTTIAKTTSTKPLATAVSLKTKQSLVTLTTERMAQEFGYLAKIFSIFAKHKISIDQISTSEISVAFTLDGSLSTHEKMLGELEKLGDVTIENGMSVVSLIGNDINNAPGLASKIFSCLETNDSKIAIRMICQGASKHNFCFLVEGKYGKESVRKLHKEFIEKDKL